MGLTHDGDAMPQGADWPPLRPETRAPSGWDAAGFETLCTHFGEDRTAAFGAATPPIVQSSTFLYPDAAAFEGRRKPESPHYDYTRVGNPTTAILESKVARLERGNWGVYFGSGMGAISAAVNACVHANAHVIAVAHCYGPTRWYFNHLRRFAVETTFVTSTDPQALLDAIRPETRLIYLESPTSGVFELLDYEPVCAAAQQRGITTIFDNSWASPYFQRPLERGVDMVVHSATKYLNGHSDVVGGIAVGRDAGLYRRVGRELELVGASPDPFAAWLTMRGLRTLPLRMEQHQRSGLEIARALAAHPRVARVLHPGLEEHPQHALGKRLLDGYAGLFSFELKDASRESLHRFLDALRLFGIGVSWGGHESLVIGGTMFSRRADRPEHLVRVSVGLESTADLLADLRQALEAAA